jgi:hypothetical protein
MISLQSDYKASECGISGWSGHHLVGGLRFQTTTDGWFALPNNNGWVVSTFQLLGCGGLAAFNEMLNPPHIGNDGGGGSISGGDGIFHDDAREEVPASILDRDGDRGGRHLGNLCDTSYECCLLGGAES